MAVDENRFIVGLVSRLTDQKGMDLIDCVMEDICSDDLQFVILGTGESRYENMFRYYEWKYKNRVSSSIMYDNTRSHRIYAACDAFLMPSLFEPCGLSQLMSLRYGTVPIVRETGGGAMAGIYLSAAAAYGLCAGRFSHPAGASAPGSCRSHHISSSSSHRSSWPVHRQ